MRHFRYTYPLELTLSIVFPDCSKNGYTDRSFPSVNIEPSVEYVEFHSVIRLSAGHPEAHCCSCVLCAVVGQASLVHCAGADPWLLSHRVGAGLWRHSPAQLATQPGGWKDAAREAQPPRRACAEETGGRGAADVDAARA
jgi:hypothetical protein